MVEINPDQYDSVRPLFSTLSHNRSIVFAVLEGNNAGRVFVDDPLQPQTAFLASITEFNFLAGDPSNESFNSQVKARLDTDMHPTSPYLLLFPASAPWKAAIDALWGSLPGEWTSRCEYDFRPQRLEARDSLQEVVPAGYTVRRYDASLAASAPGLAEFWFNLDNFLANGFGFAVLHGDKPVSRCHSVAVGDDLAEISIETDEAYRRKGLAQLACRAFIEHCQRVSIIPHWSCWINNLPSQELAQKMGFVLVEQAPARVVFYRKGG